MKSSPTRARETWKLVGAFAAFGLFWGGFAAALPAIKEATGTTEGTLGLALFCIPSAALPAMLLSGPWADRYGRRMLAPALAAFALVTVGPGLASSGLGLVPAFVALGITSGGLEVAVNGAAAAMEAERGERIMGKVHAGFSLGGLVSSVSVGLAREAGAHPALLLGSIGLIIGAIAWWNRGAPGPPARQGGRRGRMHFTRPLVLLGSLCALTFCIEAGLEGWSAIHLEDTLGASPAVGGLGPGLFMAAMVLGRVAAQSFGDRFKDTHLLVASGLVGAIGIELAAVAQNPWAALVGFWLAGLAISASAPTILSLTGRSSPPEERGTSMAAVTSIAYLGFFVSPAVVGGIADLAGLRVGLAALGGIGIVLAVLAPRVGRLKLRAVGQASGGVREPLASSSTGKKGVSTK